MAKSVVKIVKRTGLVPCVAACIFSGNKSNHIV